MDGYWQGCADSLCGAYSIVNSYIALGNEDKAQSLFDAMIELLAKKKILKSVVIGGVNHKIMSLMVNEYKSLFKVRCYTFPKFYNLEEYWKFMKNLKNPVIVSIGEKRNHMSVCLKTTLATMKMMDSNGLNSIRKKDALLVPDYDENKYVLFPTQSWMVEKEG